MIVDQASLGRTVTRFGLDLYRELPGDDNLVLSPLSVWLCLVMLVPGARGKSLEALLRRLGPREGGGGALLSHGAGRLLELLQGHQAPDFSQHFHAGGGPERVRALFTLEIANALWAADGHPFHEAFVTALREDFGAQTASLDFTDPAGAARRINEWVAEQTAGRIEDLVDGGSLSSDTRLVLTNATYFKAAWADVFEPHRTQAAPFHTPGGVVEVDLMHGEEERPHVVDPELGLQAVALAYEALHALVILPDEGRWEAVSRGLSGDVVDGLVGAMRHKEVDLFLPRFDVESGFELRDSLSRLGLGDLFGFAAELGGVSPVPEQLAVSSVVHRTTVTVDEAGTEAAAATAAIMQALALPDPQQPERVTMRVDRPFFFLVRDPDTGAVLFLARVMDPSRAGRIS